MKPTSLVALLALILLPGLAGSQEEGEMSQEKVMSLWKKWATTDEHHKELAWYLGKWDTETKITMGMGGQPPPPTKGTAEFKWIIEGRWLAEEAKSTLFGMPFQGFGILGFDRFKKKWVTTRVSNFDTAMLRFEGVVVDPTGKTRSLYCELDEYLTGEHDKMARGVYRKIDEDTFVYEAWDMTIGVDGQIVFEIAYKRKK